MKNIFCFVTFYPIVFYEVFGRRSDTLYEKVKFNFFGKNIKFSFMKSLSYISDFFNSLSMSLL